MRHGHFPRPRSLTSKAGRPPALLLLLAVPLVVIACGSGSDTTTSAGPTTSGPTTSGPTTSADPEASAHEIQLAMSEVARLAPAASQADVLSAAASLQAFGIDLYRLLATEAGDGNLVFSPSSIVTALAMTYVGAGGPTAQEMATVLHFALEGDALHQAFNSLDTALESRSWEQKSAEGEVEGVLIKTANSLWGQRDTVFEQIFLDTLAANYAAGIRLVDYKTAAEEARQAINEWVAGETNDKITDLIPEGTLDAMTRLVLVNAVYLDATWSSQFDPKLTTDGQFTTLAGDTVTTPMMKQQFPFPCASGDGWQAVELPYVGSQVAMLLIVPDVGRFTEVESGLATGLIDDVTGSLAQGPEVTLAMPKFEFRTQAGLNDALAALGMTSAFDPKTADFSGMTKEERLFISDVIHEAYIAVDEEGTEAAAATAVVMRLAGMPTETVELTVDRPFLFALRDLETGALLFLGRVTDPTA
jgi:serpin B